MTVPVAFILAFLAHSSLSFTGDELYHRGDPTNSYLYHEEYPEEAELDLRRRDANFLRFGRGDVSSLLNRPNEYDDYTEDFARPTRAGERTDHFVRFGRSKQDYHLRFGKRGKSANYLRFGRSLSGTSVLDENDDTNNKNKREKREAFSSSDFNNVKRGSTDYLRFGRNSNFLRFGRNHNEQGTVATVIPDPINYYHYNKNNNYNKEPPLVHLLSQLLSNIKKEPCKCSGDA